MRGCSQEAGAGRSSGNFRSCRPFFRLFQGLSDPKLFPTRLFVIKPASPPTALCRQLPETNCASPSEGSASEPRGRQLRRNPHRGWEGDSREGESEKSNKIQTGGVWPRKVGAGLEFPGRWKEEAAPPDRCIRMEVTLPAFPLCLLVYYFRANSGGSPWEGLFFWPEDYYIFTVSFCRKGKPGVTEVPLFCQWLSWDPYLNHAGGRKG